MSECRCADDGGAACFERARREAIASGDERRLVIVEFVRRSRRTQGLPFHGIDPVVLHRTAQILQRAASRPRRTPEQEAAADAVREVRALQLERRRHVT